MRTAHAAFVSSGVLALAATGATQEKLEPLQLMDVFELEHAADPRISPDGARVAYVRSGFDVMTDKAVGRLWIADFDGTRHRPLTTGAGNESSPRWSPDGSRIAFVSNASGSPQIHVRWMDTGESACVSKLRKAPANLAWSPDGAWIAFTMATADEVEPFVELPKAPEGAQWAPAAKVVTKLRYRFDGAGYLPDEHDQLYVMPAEGGSPRQLTEGAIEHSGPLAWTADGSAILLSANRHSERELEPMDTEIYAVSLADGSVATLTQRDGPDHHPIVSPDGASIAYLGFDDRVQGYQVTRLYVMERDGSNPRLLSAEIDRDVEAPRWSPEGDGLWFQVDDHGDTKLAFLPLEGAVEVVAEGLGGTTLGRPYGSGSFDVGPGGRFAFTHTSPARPADIAVGVRGSDDGLLLTRLNDDLLARRELAEVEALEIASSFDGRPIQAWVAKPPGFDPARRYPLILEIHGGPFANYGPRFSAEVQLYAAAGFVVLYANPRGSTSYGEEFGNLIHHAYPGQDYDDLNSCVDAAIERGFANPDELFVTGGSGGGVLTAWIVGKTDRFRAAVVSKPVINWTSFALTADAYNFFYKYWFPGTPWDEPEHYWKRSPLSLVGNVTTPTMLLTGEVDYRTPISETEQYYQALKLRGVDTAMVRIPEASHGIGNRPSHLISKVAHILRWFEVHRATQ